MDRYLLSGNEAISRGAYEAGVKVCSAYPGTPSTEIFEELPKYKDSLYCEWAPNEKVAVEVAYGASIAGVRSLSAMKHVGVNVAADPIFTAAYNGVNGGFVIVSADDPSMHSSQNEQDNRYYAKAAKIPMIEPADSQECLDFLKEAYNISEQFDVPVLFRTTTRVAHSKSIVTLNEPLNVEIKPYERNTRKNIAAPANAYLNHPKLEKTLEELLESMTPLGEDEQQTPMVDIDTHTNDMDIPTELPEQTDSAESDDTDATLELLANEFAASADEIATPAKPETRGKIGKLKNILPFKKAKRDDSGIMGDLFGWAGVANDEDFTIPGFFANASSKK